MFNSKRLQRLEENATFLTNRIAYLDQEIQRQRELLKEFSLTLPEMTDTLKSIQSKLPSGVRANVQDTTADASEAERIIGVQSGDGPVPMGKPRQKKTVRSGRLED